MKLGTREIVIGLLILVLVVALFNSGFLLSILGTLQSISLIILAWVAIFYLLKRM
jgi:hypothetical protein